MMSLMVGGYLQRRLPAKSAPAYVHHWQANPTILGLNAISCPPNLVPAKRLWTFARCRRAENQGFQLASPGIGHLAFSRQTNAALVDLSLLALHLGDGSGPVDLADGGHLAGIASLGKGQKLGVVEDRYFKVYLATFLEKRLGHGRIAGSKRSRWSRSCRDQALPLWT